LVYGVRRQRDDQSLKWDNTSETSNRSVNENQPSLYEISSGSFDSIDLAGINESYDPVPIDLANTESSYDRSTRRSIRNQALMTRANELLLRKQAKGYSVTNTAGESRIRFSHIVSKICIQEGTDSSIIIFLFVSCSKQLIKCFRYNAPLQYIGNIVPPVTDQDDKNSKI
jgi:hypothetical protein